MWVRLRQGRILATAVPNVREPFLMETTVLKLTASRFISPSVVLPAVMDKQEIHLRFWQLIYKNKGNKGNE
jgi:hypothetical protein